MKKFTFNNGEIRLESQIAKGRDFKTACMLWNLFDTKTLEPLPHTVSEANEADLKKEQIRLYQISEEYAAATYDDPYEFYICPSTGNMMDLEGNVIDDNDCNEELEGY
jgi:hypothetical protein